MAPTSDSLNELLYGAVLLDDGVKYYADWALAMQREFHGAASRLPRVFELAKQLAEFDIVQRPDGARHLLQATTLPRDSANPYASPASSNEPIVARTAESDSEAQGRQKIAALEERVRELEQRLNKSLLYSDRFGLRVLAVFGHWAIVYLLLALGVGIVMAVAGFF